MCAGAFFILVFAVFGQALGFDFSMLDDPYLVYNNLAIRGITLTNLQTIFTTFDPELYIPFTLLSYQINYVFAGLNPTFYHFTNLVLHAANATLVTCLFTFFLRKRWIAIFCGVLFAIHPLHTEAIVWIAGRKDLLATFFFLSSWISYLYFKSTHSNKWLIVSLLLFASALLSKVMILLFPLVLIAQHLLLDQKISKKHLFAITPFAALSTIFGLVALFGKTRIVASSTLTETLLMAAKSTVFYAQKLIVPTQLNVFYAYQKTISIASSDFFVPLIIVAILCVLIALSVRWTTRIFFCALFFFLTLAPTFLNFHKGEAMFFAVDRYAYVPSIALLLLIGFSMQALGRMSESLYQYRSQQRIISGLAMFVAVASFATLAYYQTSYWQTNEILFDHALAVYPDSVPARINLSVIYRETGRTDDEQKVLQDGLEYSQDESLYLGLGSVFAREKKWAEALAEFEKARSADPKSPEPDFYEASLAQDEGNEARAEELYKAAIAKDDSYVAAHNNLGQIYLDSGKLPEAETAFKKALSYNQNFMEGQYNLFQTLELQKKNDEAFPHLEKAYALNPDSPDIILSIAYRYQTRGRIDEARAALEHLLALEPDNRSAQRMLNAMIE